LHSACFLLGNNNLAFVNIITSFGFENSFFSAGMMLAAANGQKKLKTCLKFHSAGRIDFRSSNHYKRRADHRHDLS